jgi:uncharacterized protein YjiS (DUF1127 family)
LSALTSILAGDGPQRGRRMSMPAVLAALLGGIRQWRENRRAWRLLAAMSERELQDIGVCRADVSHHYWRSDKAKLHWPP